MMNRLLRTESHCGFTSLSRITVTTCSGVLIFNITMLISLPRDFCYSSVCTPNDSLNGSRSTSVSRGGFLRSLLQVFSKDEVEEFTSSAVVIDHYAHNLDLTQEIIRDAISQWSLHPPPPPPASIQRKKLVTWFHIPLTVRRRNFPVRDYSSPSGSL